MLLSLRLKIQISRLFILRFSSAENNSLSICYFLDKPLKKIKIKCLSQCILLAKVNWKSQLEFSILVVLEMSQEQLPLQCFSAAHFAPIRNIIN